MIPRTSILAAVKAALEASSTLSGVAVVLDAGTSGKTIEDYLRNDGCVVTVMPILSFGPRADQNAQAAGALVGDVVLGVRLMLNPNVNSLRVVPYDFEQLRQAVIDAVVALPADDHWDRFQFTSDELLEFDPGLMASVLSFTKGAQANPK